MGKGIPTADDIRAKVANAAFGKSLVTNVHRGLVVEAIVAAALEPEWRWCSEDYSSWDFERGGIKLEVKQSASRQSWASASGKPSACSFDIAHRTGRYEGGTQWIDAPGRNAHIYILAHHPVCDDSADHRDPAQWTFYVIPATQLPDSKRIGLGGVQGLAQGCRFENLQSTVAATAEALETKMV